MQAQTDYDNRHQAEPRLFPIENCDISVDHPGSFEPPDPLEHGRGRNPDLFGQTGVGYPAILLKNIDVIGLFWGNYRQFDCKRIEQSQTGLYDLWNAGKIKPVIDQVYPMDQAADALKRVGDRQAIGLLCQGAQAHQQAFVLPYKAQRDGTGARINL